MWYERHPYKMEIEGSTPSTTTANLFSLYYMTEIKVNLSVVLKGRTMLSEQECSKNPKESYNDEVQTFTMYDKRGKGHLERISYKTRKYIPARQSLNISKEGYEYMTGKERPDFFRGSSKRWENMSKKERIEAHLQEICSSLNGVSYTYKVFDD